MPKKTATESLTGKELLQKVKELGNLSRTEKAKACGYVSTSKNGRERVNLMQFYNALIEAEGIPLDGKGRGAGKVGKRASYRTSVQSSGNLLIGSAYTKQMGLQPGDEFEISLKRKHIHLRLVSSASSMNEEADS